MAHRLINSPTDPHRIIRDLRLPQPLQQSLEICLELIESADSIIVLSHAHGRALGLGMGLAAVSTINRSQFIKLAEVYTRAFECQTEVLSLRGH